MMTIATLTSVTVMSILAITLTIKNQMEERIMEALEGKAVVHLT